jgi:hypothetical protein
MFLVLLYNILHIIPLLKFNYKIQLIKEKRIEKSKKLIYLTENIFKQTKTKRKDCNFNQKIENEKKIIQFLFFYYLIFSLNIKENN